MNPLERAAELIERHGWCRGAFRDAEGRLCVDFALLLADLRRNSRARQLVLEELASRGAAARSVADWNDTHARDEFEVLDVLCHAAKRWQAGERTLT